MRRCVPSAFCDDEEAEGADRHRPVAARVASRGATSLPALERSARCSTFADAALRGDPAVVAVAVWSCGAAFEFASCEARRVRCAPRDATASPHPPSTPSVSSGSSVALVAVGRAAVLDTKWCGFFTAPRASCSPSVGAPGLLASAVRASVTRVALHRPASADAHHRRDGGARPRRRVYGASMHDRDVDCRSSVKCRAAPRRRCGAQAGTIACIDACQAAVNHPTSILGKRDLEQFRCEFAS